MNIDNLTSKTISSLRFPLTVGIVFIHFNLAQIGIVAHGVEHKLDYSWYNIVVTLFSDVLPRVGVPLFFFISGFLFFNSIDFGLSGYWKKIQKRARTLLLPFILWNAIAIVWQLLKIKIHLSSLAIGEISIKSLGYTMFWNWREGGLFLPSSSLLSTIDISQGVYPIDVPMWYVRELMITVLVTPLLFFMIKKGKSVFLIVLGLFWIIFSVEGTGFMEQILTSVFFFSWGAFYSIYKIDFVRAFQSFPFVLYLSIPLAIIDCLTKDLSYGAFIHNAFVLFGIVSVVILFSWLLQKSKFKINSVLTNSSFFCICPTLSIYQESRNFYIHAIGMPVFFLFFNLFLFLYTCCYNNDLLRDLYNPK